MKVLLTSEQRQYNAVPSILGKSVQMVLFVVCLAHITMEMIFGIHVDQFPH
jgi:hypothetical protein